jgi:hypothetical protein
MSVTRVVEIPGRYLSGVAYLDLETVKVPCDWTSPAGEKLGRRWSAFLAGVAWDGAIRLVEREEGETELGYLASVRNVMLGSDTIVYRATRKFDEMILKGRYTYARRGPAPEPFYPVMPEAEDLTWSCERPDPDGFWESVRERELASRNVSETWMSDPGLVRLHLLRDVCELIGAYGEADPECEDWLVRVLSDDDFARDLLV